MKQQIAFLGTHCTVLRDRCDLPTFNQLTRPIEFSDRLTTSTICSKEIQMQQTSFSHTGFWMYIQIDQNLPDMVSYHNASVQLQQQDARTEQAIKDRAQKLRQEEADADGSDVEDPDTALHGCVVDPPQTAMNDIREVNDRMERRCDTGSLQAAYAELNTDQKRVVDRVLSHIYDRKDQNALMLFGSGAGGTGKSRNIDVLQRLVCIKLVTKSTLAVVVTAPTGFAAFNISGSTIHRTFCLPVEHGKPADYKLVNAEQLTVIRATLKNLALLIIDEASTISSLTLRAAADRNHVQ